MVLDSVMARIDARRMIGAPWFWIQLSLAKVGLHWIDEHTRQVVLKQLRTLTPESSCLGSKYVQSFTDCVILEEDIYAFFASRSSESEDNYTYLIGLWGCNV